MGLLTEKKALKSVFRWCSDFDRRMVRTARPIKSNGGPKLGITSCLMIVDVSSNPNFEKWPFKLQNPEDTQINP
jgi:hypothetical protein